MITWIQMAAMVVSVSAREVMREINTENYFNILSIDGGGIRGILPA